MPVVQSALKSDMLQEGTPIEYYKEFDLYVKREDLACLPPGPPFSKARGVFARVESRPEEVIGVLDTRHSQAGWAVARACQILGKTCINYYPSFKKAKGPHVAQQKAAELGARLVPLPAGRSAILYHYAKKDCLQREGYMMPNALKLEESVEETAKEVPFDTYDNVLISISSGTIAAGVILGFARLDLWPRYILHMGYKRSREEVEHYVKAMAGVIDAKLTIIDEGYKYSDSARPGRYPPFPCNEYYDLKAFRWWIKYRHKFPGKTLFWNIG